MKTKILIIITSLLLFQSLVVAQQNDSSFFVGSTMDFTTYLQERCGIIFKENNIPKDPFQSLKDNGCNVIRRTIMNPPFKNNFTVGDSAVDWGAWDRVMRDCIHARQLGMDILLTYLFSDFSTGHSEGYGLWVPRIRENIHNDTVLADTVYKYVFRTLKELGDSNSLPKIVSIGGEVNTNFLYPDSGSGIVYFLPERNAFLLNAGIRAVKEIALIYNTNIKSCIQVGGVKNIKWYINEHWPAGLKDFDILGASYYPGWEGEFENFPELVQWLKNNYNKEFLIMETAAPYCNNCDYDNRNDVYSYVPVGYANPPTPESQKTILTDLTRKIKSSGGLGVVYWGGEWIGSDCYIYPDMWGRGSSWNNNTFWDSNYNLHAGIDWMNVDYNLPVNIISSEQFSDNIYLYPNPVADWLTIDVKTTDNLNSVIIFDIVGRPISYIDASKNEKPLHYYFGDNPNGIYIICLSYKGNFNIFRKIIVNKSNQSK